jgi:hypothetical protein
MPCPLKEELRHAQVRRGQVWYLLPFRLLSAVIL